MNDEEWKASNLRKEQFKEHAKNPTEGMTVYRMQSGDPEGSLGIHWTTDPNVAHHTGLGGSGDDRTVHRATISPDQVISQSEWMGNDIRSVYSKEPFKTGKSQWGLDMEAELRLRPGTTVRDHATAPAGVHEWTPTGREPTIEDRGTHFHVDLAHHAVQGTPEANRLHAEQSTLPHIQQALFDPVVNEKTGENIGYTPKFDLLRPDMSFREAARFLTDDVNRIGKAAGLGEWGARVEEAHEPLLTDLPRSRHDEFHAAHHTARGHTEEGYNEYGHAVGLTQPFADPGSISVRFKGA